VLLDVRPEAPKCPGVLPDYHRSRSASLCLRGVKDPPLHSRGLGPPEYAGAKAEVGMDEEEAGGLGQRMTSAGGYADDVAAPPGDLPLVVQELAAMVGEPGSVKPGASGVVDAVHDPEADEGAGLGRLDHPVKVPRPIGQVVAEQDCLCWVLQASPGGPLRPDSHAMGNRGGAAASPIGCVRDFTKPGAGAPLNQEPLDMTSRVRTGRAVVLLTLAVIALSVGCTKQRPLHVLKADAEFAAGQGQYDKAKADYSEYIRRRPEATEIRYQLAKVQVANGEPRQAIEQLNIALDVEPMNDTYLDAQAHAMFEAKEFEALTTLLSRNASERGRVEDYLRLGTYAAKMGNADEAQQALLTAAKLDQGKSLRPQKALADFYGAIGDRDRQVRRLRMAYFLEPASPDLLTEIRRLGEVPGPSFAVVPEESGQ